MEYPFKDLLPLDEVLEREGYYKDWTHLDPEVFYSLTQISEYIKTKGYGVDVRLLIAQLAEHFGLKTTQVVDLANLLQQKFNKLEGVTQSFTDNINSLVAQMEADKNAVIANATVDSEVILARSGKATLGDRLDDTDAQLVQNQTRLEEISVNVANFGAIGDGVYDCSEAIEQALEVLEGYGGGELYFPVGTWRITKTIKMRGNAVHLVGAGDNSEILYDGPVYNSIDNNDEGLAVVYFGREVDEVTSTRFIHNSIRNVKINGGLKALWGIYAYRASYNFKIENVSVRRAVGHIYTWHCYYASFDNVTVEFNTPVKPSAMLQSDWDEVHEMGLVYTEEFNGGTMNRINVTGFGTLASGQKVKNLFRIHGTTVTLENILIEDSWKKSEGTLETDFASVENIFNIFNANINIKGVHIEKVDADRLVYSNSFMNHNITLDHVYVNNSHFYRRLLSFLQGENIKVGKIQVNNTELDNTNASTFIEGSHVNLTEPIIWRQGQATRIGGFLYYDTNKDRTLGLPATKSNQLANGSNLPKILSGFDVNVGKDSVSVYVAVKFGDLINHEGKALKLGVKETEGTGLVLRPSFGISNVKYYVCVDVFGGVFLENPDYPRVSNASGKIILGLLTINGSGNPSFSEFNNDLEGWYINGCQNKHFSSHIHPNTLNIVQQRGDRAISTNTEELGSSGNKYMVSGWVCTSTSNKTWLEERVYTGN